MVFNLCTSIADTLILIALKVTIFVEKLYGLVFSLVGERLAHQFLT
jgi:hypothetical protein